MKEMSKYCFVIQPISDSRFIKRFDDIYKPAIEAAGLIAYRVDQDASVKTPIEDIEKGINNSALCFVDITTDNPNVWYEFGYAYAKRKGTVIVCEDNARAKFPFDVSHRSIIPYKTESSSDFESLKESITTKCREYLLTEEKAEKMLISPVRDTEGMKPFEIAILGHVIGEQLTDEQNVSIFSLSTAMEKSGFNKTAVSIGIRLLKQKDLITTSIENDWNGEEYNACKLTELGVNYIIDNEQLFNTEQLSTTPISGLSSAWSNDLPF